MPQLLNNSITNWRRCSNVFRCPFSAATSELQLARMLAEELPPLMLQPVPMPLLGCNGVRGVRGDRSVSFVFKSAQIFFCLFIESNDRQLLTYLSIDRY